MLKGTPSMYPPKNIQSVFLSRLSQTNRRLRDFWQQSDFFRAWRNQCSEILSYSRIFGGLYGLVSSPFLHCAIVLGVLCKVIGAPDPGFGQVGIAILPNLLGFTIGGMAIVLSVAGHKIFISLAEEGDPRSFFIKLIVAVLHYIIVQVSTLIFCVVDYNKPNGVVDLLVAIMLMYCLCLAVSIGIQLFQMARIYNAHASIVERE